MDPGARTYDVYGLRIRSEVPLPVPRIEEGADPDLSVEWGPRAEVPDARPDGTPLSVLAAGARRFWLTESPDGYLVRFNRRCDFHVGRDLRRIEVRLDPRQDASTVQDQLRTVLIQLLRLRGSCVLHASAVELEGKALALAGPGGTGKSTLAALLCAAGGRLVTDDVLRVEFTDRAAVCFPGPALIRLRPESAALVEFFPDSTPEETPDGRIAIFPASASGRFDLEALLLPALLPGLQAARIRRLAPPEAVIAMRGAAGAHPGTRAGLRSIFQAHASLAERIPVLRAEVPLDPKPDLDLPEVLLRATGFPIPR